MHDFILTLQCFLRAMEMHVFCGLADRNLMGFDPECPNLKSASFLRVGGPFFGNFNAPDGKSAERPKTLTISAIIPRIQALSGGGWFSSVLLLLSRD